MGPMGGMPTGELPTEAMKKLRPGLLMAVLGCTLALIGKFVGRQQSTAMTDIFPIGFGFIVLFSKNYANTCGMLFLLFSAMATLFAIYYLIVELAAPDTGGANFFSTDCKAEPSYQFKSGAVQKICANEYIEGESETCTEPFTCARGNITKTFQHGAYLYTKDNRGQTLTIIFKDACTPYTVIGHTALIISVIFNGLAAYMGWKIFQVTRSAFDNQPEEQPLNDGTYDGGVRPPMRATTGALLPPRMGPSASVGSGSTAGGGSQATAALNAFTAFSGQGQRLGAT